MKRKKRISLKDEFKPIISATRDLTTKSILTKALDFNSGIESQLQNPDKMLTANNKDLTLFDTMLLDDKIRNTLEIFKKMVTSVGGAFTSASDDPIDEEIAQFVDKTFNNMKIRFWDVFDNLLDARAYGFKCGELMWDIKDSKAVLTNIKFKHSLFFDFEYDDVADLKGVHIGYRVAKDTLVAVDEFKQKFIYFVNPYMKDQNYYGESDLTSIYEAWRAKVKISRFRNIYLQNFGFPIPICIYDSQKISKGEKDDLDDQLENFQEMMYFLIPGVRGADGKLLGKIDIQFHKAETSGGSASFSEAIDQLDKQISRKLLIPDKAGFSESAGGSYNLGEQQFDALKIFIVDTQGRLEDALDPVIKLLVDFNFPNVEKYPKWKFESEDAKLSENFLKILIDSKIIDKREKWIRSYVGIPEITPEEQTEIDEYNEAHKPVITTPFGQQPGDQVPEDNQKEDELKLKNEIPVNFKKIKCQYDSYETEFINDFNKIMFNVQLEVIKQVKSKKIIENNDMKLIDSLRIPKTELKDLYSNYFAKLYITGKADSANEMESRLDKAQKAMFKNEYMEFKPTADELWLDREWVDKYLKQYGSLGKLSAKDKKYLHNYRQKAFYLTGETEQKVINTVATTISSGIRNGLQASVIIAKIAEEISAEREKYAITIARTNSSEAYNSGRMNLFMDDKISPFIEAYQYSAIMDDVTTEFCAQHDGQIIYPSDPEFSTINPPNHYNCRSLLIPIMVGDKDNSNDYYNNYDKNFKTWGTGVTKEGRVQSKDFGG
jgi:SPP1 gp7 family putative phage head morphogenesis protein